MEKRGGALIDIDKVALEARMKDYFNADLSWEEYKARQRALVERQGRFVPPAARRKALSAEGFSENRLVRYALRPFDTRWCYYTGVRPVWNEPRPTLWEQRFEGNAYLVCRPSGVASPEGVPIFFTGLLGDNDFQRGHAYYFAVRLPPTVKGNGKTVQGQGAMFRPAPKGNLSLVAREYLAGLGVGDPDASAEVAGLVWMHALAVGYSPAYLAENADGIRRDWPRVPLPDSRKALKESADLGQQVAALLDTEAAVRGVTASPLEAIFKTVGVLSKVDGGALDADAGDLALTAGWGHAGKEGVTMPGKGRIVQRMYSKAEQEAIADAAKARGLSRKQALALLGGDTRDVYLSETAYWRNVPANVWEYFIGGYQVIKKWLSYRQQDLLGRPLMAEEAREVMNMARRLAAIVLLQPALDENYRRVKAKCYAWPAAAPPAGR